MHDGRFVTLEQVLEHYSNGVTPSPTLAAELQKQERLGIPLTAAEKEYIVLFLNTLTDEEFAQKSELPPARK